MDCDPSRRGSLGEVARLFLKLGAIGFGGPVAHIAMMRDEVVRRRHWMDDDEFLEWVGATNLIPGPNSTELAIHLGHQRAGWRGLLVAGVCFIAPAVVIVTTIAWLYEHHGTDPHLLDIRSGVLPVVVAIIAQALVGLGRTALTNAPNVVIAAATFAGYLAGFNELLLLLIGGVFAAALALRHRPPRRLGIAFVALAGGESASLWRLFLVFLEIGSVLYGSGYVLLAFLQRLLVDDLGWLTSQQLLDAITIGQITPGPVFTTATFVGWQVDGPAGALVATVGIFLPSFVLVALLARIVPWIRARPVARAFLGGVTLASLGLMAGVFVELTREALVDVFTVVVAALALVALLRTKVNSAWLVAAGVAIGVAKVVAA